MTVFKPCQGKHACRDDGERCLTCGRTLEEIGRLRDLTDRLTTLAIDYEYENVEQFTQYLAKKISGSINYRRQLNAPVNLLK